MSNTDKVLEILAKNPNSKILTVSRLTWIMDFIKKTNLEPGNTYVFGKDLYALYCSQNNPPLRRKIFTQLFVHFFKIYRNYAGTWVFKLNPAPLNLPLNYSVWRRPPKKYEIKKTKFKNIQHTPEGWMVYLDIEHRRRFFGWVRGEKFAARAADQCALLYYGENYHNLNFKDSKLDTESQHFKAMVIKQHDKKTQG